MCECEKWWYSPSNSPSSLKIINYWVIEIFFIIYPLKLVGLTDCYPTPCAPWDGISFVSGVEQFPWLRPFTWVIPSNQSSGHRRDSLAFPFSLPPHKSTLLFCPPAPFLPWFLPFIVLSPPPRRSRTSCWARSSYFGCRFRCHPVDGASVRVPFIHEGRGCSHEKEIKTPEVSQFFWQVQYFHNIKQETLIIT